LSGALSRSRERGGGCIERSPDAGDELACDARRLVAPGALKKLIDRGADDDRVGDAATARRSVRASRMPKPTPTGSFTCA
jgi:hypothetical protein